MLDFISDHFCQGTECQARQEARKRLPPSVGRSGPSRADDMSQQVQQRCPGMYCQPQHGRANQGAAEMPQSLDDAFAYMQDLASEMPSSDQIFTRVQDLISKHASALSSSTLLNVDITDSKANAKALPPLTQFASSAQDHVPSGIAPVITSSQWPQHEGAHRSSGSPPASSPPQRQRHEGSMPGSSAPAAASIQRAQHEGTHGPGGCPPLSSPPQWQQHEGGHPRAGGAGPAVEYEAMMEDPLDQAVKDCLKKLPSHLAAVLFIERLNHGEYEVDNHRVKIGWGGVAGSRDVVVFRADQPNAGKGEPLLVYLLQAGEIMHGIRSGGTAIMQVPKHLRISFPLPADSRDSQPDEDPRWDAMRLAKKEAEMRERAAQEWRQNLFIDDHQAMTKGQAQQASDRTMPHSARGPSSCMAPQARYVPTPQRAQAQSARQPVQYSGQGSCRAPQALSARAVSPNTLYKPQCSADSLHSASMRPHAKAGPSLQRNQHHALPHFRQCGSCSQEDFHSLSGAFPSVQYPRMGSPMPDTTRGFQSLPPWLAK